MVHNIQKYKQYIKTELRYKVKVYELVEHMDHSIGDMTRNIVCSLKGCPISAILFILVTEILSIKIKQDRNIHGIKMKNTTGTLREVKLTQYADDTTFLLEDETSITPLLKLLKTFSEVSRLRINIDKTECKGIGRLKDIKGDVHGIKMNEKPIKSLHQCV